MIFEWDEKKNSLNKLKHGIAFEDALQIFRGNFSIIYDEEHCTNSEDRYWAIGPLKSHGPIIVVFTEIHEDIIRIISARKATRAEADRYEKT